MGRTLTIRGGTLALPDGLMAGDLRIGPDGRISAIGALLPFGVARGEGEAAPRFQPGDARERDARDGAWGGARDGLHAAVSAAAASAGAGVLRAGAADVEALDGEETIDATGLLVMPGVIDPQVHFREPGLTHKEDLASGSRACAAGGITSFLEMPNTSPPTTTAEALAFKMARAAEVSVTNYGFFIGATADNLEIQNSVEGVPGIKVFMGSSTGGLLVSDPLALEAIFGQGRRLIAVHAESEARLVVRKAAFAGRTDPAVHSEIRDPRSALLATQLAVSLSDRFRRRLHILHMSTRDEVELLEGHGKAAGRITCEVTPQHLLLEAAEAYARLGTRAQMNPPLRSATHLEALWHGLRTGLIDCIATDHAPHTLEEKARPYGEAPSGMPGVETSLPLMLDAAHRGLCSVTHVVRWMCEGPARCYGIQGKGRLEVGYDGDLTLVDLARRATVEGPYRTKCGWSPFEGQCLTGWPVMTIVGGQVVYREGAICEDVRGMPLRFAA